MEKESTIQPSKDLYNLYDTSKIKEDTKEEEYTKTNHPTWWCDYGPGATNHCPIHDKKKKKNNKKNNKKKGKEKGGLTSRTK